MNPRRSLTDISALVLSGLLLFAACSPKKGGAAAAGPDPAVPGDGNMVVIPAGSAMMAQLKMEPVALASLPIGEVVAPGRIEFDPSRVGRIALPVPGRIEEVLVHIGDRVAAGQALFSIDSPDADAALSEFRQSQAAVSQTESALTKAQADRDREAELFDHKAIPRKDLLAAENELVQAQAALAQTQAALEHSRRRLEILGLNDGKGRQLVTVKAPMAGKVIDMTMSTGEYRNDTTTPVVTVADLSVVWVTSSVPENMIRLIDVGEEIQVELVAFPGETFKARVRRIADTLDPKTRAIEVRAELGNSDGRLKPEMFGTIRHAHLAEPVPVVPVQAILRKGGATYVYMEMKPGRFACQQVELGQASGDRVPVAKGLRPGDRVVVDGVMLLSGLEAR